MHVGPSGWMVRVPSLPPWPADPPAHGRVALRAVTDDDVALVRALAADPYVPTIGSVPADPDDDTALAWVRRQQARHAEGAGFSFTITEAAAGRAVGHCGLWLRHLAERRATAGYAIVPTERGRGLAVDALVALTRFAWTVPGVARVDLHVEPWNVASLRTAERAGYVCEAVLRRHQPVAGELRDVLLLTSSRPAGPTDLGRLTGGIVAH